VSCCSQQTEVSRASADRGLDPAAGVAHGTRKRHLGYRRIHGELALLGPKPHGTWSWTWRDAGSSIRYLIHDRDGKFCAAFDKVLADAGIQVVLSGVRVPRMNAVIERWVGTCRRELLDRALIWNQAHLL
jgi:hypothetical protein